MAHQVLWTDRICEDFCRLANLSDDECFIIRTRSRGYTVSYQAMQLNCSEITIHRKISLLKKKYDAVQKEYPDRFPVRITSKTEDFMDNN